MRRIGPKRLVLSILLVVASYASFGPSSRPSSGQQQQRAHLICCNMLVSVPGTWIGADRNCADYLQQAPENVRADVCKQLKDSSAFRDGSCMATMAPFCPSAKPPDTKCEPPAPPWFGPSSDCKDVQEAQITTTRTAVTVYLCGYKIFSYSGNNVPSDQLYTDAYRAALRDYFRANVGKVCCNRFRQAARTGQPCNARVDIDCDGKPNESDMSENGMPNFEGRGVRIPDGVNFDDFPPGMTDDEIAPPAGECKDCKWVLMSGELKCSPDGRQRHVYQARWYCPSTKVEVDKFHYAPATAPCTPPNRPTPGN